MAPTKTKLSAEEQRTRRDDRVMAIRLRMAIGQELDARGITTAATIGEALGMPAAEAHGILNRRQWREGDVAILQACGAVCGVMTEIEARGRRQTRCADPRLPPRRD